ncbi:hypothetical protein B566_EDAN012798 [Ephemera danica]|nr:hypothetical protein B566_EDAN012798 [Ephemera danica]
MDMPRPRTGLGPLGLLLNLLAATLVTTAQARDPTLLPPRLQVDSERRTVKLLERKDTTNDIATFSDYTSRVIAYRDRKERMCYLERMTVGNMQQQLRLLSAQYMKAMPPRLEKTLYTAPGRLQVWQLAGRKVAEFCRGLSAALLQPGPPGSVVNELPVEENDVRVFQDPELFKPQRHVVHRTKRQTNNPPGRKYRGQSQSQFVTFRGTNTGDSSPGGLAEGTSQHDRAVARVSASNGMGQAQSQSSFDDDCEGCSGRSQGFPPDPISRPGYSDGSTYYRPGSDQTGYPTYGQLPSGQPGLISDGRRPGQLPGGYPSSTSLLPDGQRPGQLPGGHPGSPQTPQRPPGSLTDGQRPGQLTGGYPSSTSLLPGDGDLEGGGADGSSVTTPSWLAEKNTIVS